MLHTQLLLGWSWPQLPDSWEIITVHGNTFIPSSEAAQHWTLAGACLDSAQFFAHHKTYHANVWHLLPCIAGRQIINKLYDIPPAYVRRPFTYPIYKHPVCTHYFGLYTFDALAGFKVQSSLPMTTNHCYSLKQALKNFPMDQLVVISRAWRKKRPPFLQTNCQKLNPSDGPP